MQYKQIPVYTLNKTITLIINSQTLNLTLQQMKQYIKQHIGFSTSIQFYLEPLSSHTHLAFLSPTLTLAQVLALYPTLCITHNNTPYLHNITYHQQHTYSTNTSDSVQIIVQLCQERVFCHQSYRIKTNSKISLLRAMVNRFGTYIYVLYCGMRVCLDKFSDGDIVGDVFAIFVDCMNRINVTVSNADDGLPWIHPITSTDILNSQHKALTLHGQHYALNCKCSLDALRQLYLMNEGIPISIISETQKQVIIQPLEKSLHKLPQPLTNCVFIGITQQQPSHTLYFISNSAILHQLHYNNNAYTHLHTHYLHSPQTPSLDETLYLLKQPHIIGYSITINHLTLYYHNLNGQLLFIHRQQWPHQLYDIDFNVFDMFCVRLKNRQVQKSVRVFKVQQMSEWTEVDYCEKFFPAVQGTNSHSDGCGLFAVQHCYGKEISVHGIQQGKISCIVTTEQVQHVIFSTTHTYICIQYKHHPLNIHKLTGELLHRVNTEAYMKRFLFMNDELYCTHGSSLIKWEKQWQKPYMVGKNNLIYHKGLCFKVVQELQWTISSIFHHND